jgi:hypothetical protein
MPTYKEGFETKGYHISISPVARKPTEFKIYPSDLALFASWDTSLVWDQFPPSADVLTMHGLQDKTVPP